MADYCSLIIKDCTNSSDDIRIKATFNVGNVKLGGIIGRCFGSTIKNCTNYGNIIIPSSLVIYPELLEQQLQQTNFHIF